MIKSVLVVSLALLLGGCALVGPALDYLKCKLTPSCVEPPYTEK